MPLRGRDLEEVVAALSGETRTYDRPLLKRAAQQLLDVVEAQTPRPKEPASQTEWRWNTGRKRRKT